MLTDYKYRKARKMVKSADISRGGKEIFFCALRQYKKGVVPTDGLFQDQWNGVKRACIVGAAIADKMAFGNAPKDSEGFDDWENAAVKEFGVKKSSVCNIEQGFDAYRYKDVPSSRYARLSYNLGKLIGMEKE